MNIAELEIKIVPPETFKLKGFSKKYQKILKSHAILSVSEYLKKHPHWTLVQVMANILNESDPNLPPEHLTELINHIIEAWQHKMTKTATPILAEAA
jgi:hypothetical protein